jgi:hypothetical protein
LNEKKYQNLNMKKWSKIDSARLWPIWKRCAVLQIQHLAAQLVSLEGIETATGDWLAVIWIPSERRVPEPQVGQALQASFYGALEVKRNFSNNLASVEEAALRCLSRGACPNNLKLETTKVLLRDDLE